MVAWFESLVAPEYAPAVMWTAVALALLIVLLIVLRLMRGLTAGTFVMGGRNRKTRLAVMDATAVDTNRRLVLVRRDDVEHLILIGGPTDLVVEQNIRPNTPASGLGDPDAIVPVAGPPAAVPVAPLAPRPQRGDPELARTQQTMAARTHERRAVRPQPGASVAANFPEEPQSRGQTPGDTSSTLESATAPAPSPRTAPPVSHGRPADDEMALEAEMNRLLSDISPHPHR